MNAFIKTYTLKNVEVQQNGIIRNEKGRLIARFVDGIDFEGEHIAGVAVKKNKFEAGDFEKIKTAIFVLAQAIEDGSTAGVCDDVTEALYPESDVIEHPKRYCNGEPCICGDTPPPLQDKTTP